MEEEYTEEISTGEFVNGTLDNIYSSLGMNIEEDYSEEL